MPHIVPTPPRAGSRAAFYRPKGAALLVLLASACASSAVAQSLRAPAGVPEPEDRLPAAPQASDPSQDRTDSPTIATSLGSLADPLGARAALARAGLTFTLTYLGETLGVVSGGQRRGAIYEGLLNAQADLSLERAFGWSGATVHASAFQIHGQGLSRTHLGNLMTVSGIEALPATRLSELFLEQTALNGRIAVRIGQLAADTDFITSQYASVFVNASFGWPAITGIDLPNGGPAYPLATPGIRVRLAPSDDWTLSAGLYDGAPSGRGPGDPQRTNSDGLAFRTSDPALLIGEAAYTYGGPAGAGPLPGVVKLGAWHHLGRFDDQARDAEGRALADPSGSGIARRLRGNDGVYAVIDQLLLRENGTAPDQGLAAFVRGSLSPGDRNLVSAYLDGGLTYKGLLPGRPADTLGIAAGYTGVSAGARRRDRDVGVFDPANPVPRRSSEIILEATYQAQIVPGWSVQPDLQYVIRPGGTVLNPRSANPRIERDAVVAGVRSVIRY